MLEMSNFNTFKNVMTVKHSTEVYLREKNITLHSATKYLVCFLSHVTTAMRYRYDPDVVLYVIRDNLN